MRKSRKPLVVVGLIAVFVAGVIAFGANTSLFKGSVTFTPMVMSEVTPADGSFLTETTEFSVVTNVPAICSYRVLRSDRGFPHSRKMIVTEQEDGSYKHSITVIMNRSRSMDVRRYIKCSDYYVNVKEAVLNLTVAPTPVITDISPLVVQNGDTITITGDNFDSLIPDPNATELYHKVVHVKFDDFEVVGFHVSDNEVTVRAIHGTPSTSRLTLLSVAHPEIYYASSNQIVHYYNYGEIPEETPAEPDRLTLTDARPNGTVSSNRVLFQVNTDREADCTYRASANLSGSTQYPMAKSDFSDGIQKHSITLNITGGDSDTIHTRYLRCTDSIGDTEETQVQFNIDLPEVVDTNAPMISVEKIGVLPIGTKGATLRATTDEPASCTYKLAGLSSADTNTRMDSSDMLSHTANLIGLVAGKYTYQITCADRSGNVSKPASIEFEIKADTKTPLDLKKSV